MKFSSIIFCSFFAIIFVSSSNAQINFGEKALGALQNGVASFTFTNEDAARLSIEAVRKMDSTNIVADSKNGYAIRLNRIFGKHANENGLNLNYKVYLTKEINAFATADGSVRVYSGLMDIMDDNQLLAVIGHEIGHVANEDTKDAMKSALRKEAFIGAVSSQSNKVAQLTDSQLGQLGRAMIDSKHSRKQETEADDFSYNFMKKHRYDVNAVESAFTILANQNGGVPTDFLSRMMSSHPDPIQRAENSKQRAIADGLYKVYLQKPINNKVVTTVKKPTTTKKTTTKKKK